MKSYNSFVLIQKLGSGGMRGSSLLVDPTPALVGKKGLKRMPSSAALLGKAEEEDEDDSEEYSEVNRKPFEMAALKARAFRITRKERKEDVPWDIESDLVVSSQASTSKKIK